MRTIGHTIELIRMSWRVLMKDRELIVFPILSGIGVLIAAGAFFLIASVTGTLDRIAAEGADTSPGALDIALSLALYVAGYFIVIFFNAALVAAALERLRGGDPNVGSGLRAAATHLPQILGWAIIAATVGLILQLARGRTDNFLGRVALAMVGGVWAYLTFFVVPVLVAEGLGPIAAIRRSGSLFRRTWGQQVAASFGFGLVYILVVLVAFLPAAAIFAVSPIAGLAAGAVIVGLTVATVQALEGIFKAALYEFANGEAPLGFDSGTLSDAYRAL